MKEYTSTEIIAKRDNIIAEIAKIWNIIEKENVVHNGYKRAYNIKGSYTYVRSLVDKLVETKIALQCLNMGLDNVPEDINYKNIFRLTEINKIRIQLKNIPTLASNVREFGSFYAKKYKEILSESFIADELSALDLEEIRIKKKMSDFNDNTTFNLNF